MNQQVLHGKSEEVMKGFPDNHFDSIVTDPPYGFRFMNKKWDYNVPGVALWQEVLRVLKPGGFILCACGTRTQHRMVINIEDAGFEIRDVITWHYGSGFPKSLDISKAIDSKFGAKREVTGQAKRSGKPSGTYGAFEGNNILTAPATDAAKQWNGWGTALKPATEFWTLARKPLSESTIAENVLLHGTGGINIDGCRIESNGDHKRPDQPTNNSRNVYGEQAAFTPTNAEGRFPANLILDDFMAGEMDIQAETKASRFFYCAKASKAERNAGTTNGNNHPTVKPISLMRYLCRLITPPKGTILDPFSGSGSTLIAAELEGFHSLGIDDEPQHVETSKQRIKHWKQKSLFGNNNLNP